MYYFQIETSSPALISPRGVVWCELSLDATSWDDEAEARLAELIVANPGGIKHRWLIIARALGGGKNADDCLRRIRCDAFIITHRNSSYTADVDCAVSAETDGST